MYCILEHGSVIPAIMSRLLHLYYLHSNKHPEFKSTFFVLKSYVGEITLYIP